MKTLQQMNLKELSQQELLKIEGGGVLQKVWSFIKNCVSYYSESTQCVDSEGNGTSVQGVSISINF